MWRAVAVLAGLLGWPASAAAQQAAAPTECDRLAASPYDTDAVAEGVPLASVDGAASIAACRKAVAAFPGERRLLLQLGRALQAAGEAEEARTLFRAAAEAGSAAAQNNYAGMLMDGLGGKPDRAEAIRWFTMAAEAGNPVAQFNLGEFYVDGRAVAHDDAAAFSWYRLAAAQGIPLARTRLGAMHQAGYATKVDLVAAASLYAWAIAGGETELAPRGLAALEEQVRVQAAQRMLNALGYDAGPEDGRLGGRTGAAIAAFSAAHGLAADGGVTQDLLAALAGAAAPLDG